MEVLSYENRADAFYLYLGKTVYRIDLIDKNYENVLQVLSECTDDYIYIYDLKNDFYRVSSEILETYNLPAPLSAPKIRSSVKTRWSNSGSIGVKVITVFLPSSKGTKLVSNTTLLLRISVITAMRLFLGSLEPEICTL